MRSIFFEKLILLKQLFITLNENFGPKPHCCVAPTVVNNSPHHGKLRLIPKDNVKFLGDFRKKLINESIINRGFRVKNN